MSRAGARFSGPRTTALSVDWAAVLDHVLGRFPRLTMTAEI